MPSKSDLQKLIKQISPKPKILIVEDEPLLLRMYERKFNQDLFEVKTAMNGQEAIDALVNFSPDIILCDIMMPTMNGLQFLQHQRDHNSQTPIVILTNLPGDEYVEAAIELGAASYIIKTQMKPQEVVNKVRELLTAKGQALPVI